jgi:hypothetical protein
MQPHTAYLWTKAPAFRLLVPFTTGIVVQWYAPLSLQTILLASGLLLPLTVAYRFLPLAKKYLLAPHQGLLLFVLIASVGPSRVLHRVAPVVPFSPLQSFTWQGQHVLIIDSTVRLRKDLAPQKVDLLILSGNPAVYMQALQQSFKPGLVVADASVPRWKAALWKRDCAALCIPFYDVEEKGAFVLSR